MTYRILVREREADREIELCRVDTNPDDIVEALRGKTLYVELCDSLRCAFVHVPKYESVRHEEI